MPDKSVELRLILSGIFLMSDFFDKCSVFLLRFSINADPKQQKPAEANACYGKKVMLLGKLPPWRWRLLLT